MSQADLPALDAAERSCSCGDRSYAVRPYAAVTLRVPGALPGHTGRMSDSTGEPAPLTVRIGREELVVRQRYEVLSIINDILIALWFIVGSVLFFFEDWVVPGTWCFLFGSVELLVRPVIRLSRQLHLRRIAAVHGSGHESSQDY